MSARPAGTGFGATAGHTVHDTLGVEAVEVTADRVVLTLPVTPAVHQPYGILHGGVSALLAESAASLGAAKAAAPGHHVVGIELNASHLRPVRRGTLTATAIPVRKGRSVQVWEVALTDDGGREVCRARCTLAVQGGPPPAPAGDGSGGGGHSGPGGPAPA